MRKIIFFVLIVIFIYPVFTEEYNFTQADIDKFFSFAEGYLSLAKKYIPNKPDFGLEDYYYSDDEKLFNETGKYLTKYGWEYLKLNDFIYIIRITLDYIGLVDAYGAELGKELDSLREGITDNMLQLVRKNKDKLTKYFRLTDYSDMENYNEEEYTDETNDNPVVEEAVADITDISGTWYLESDNSFVWNFKKDGTVSISQITAMAADVGSWKGTYKLEKGVLSFKLDKPHPFPNKFTVKGNKLIGDDDSLIKKN